MLTLERQKAYCNFGVSNISLERASKGDLLKHIQQFPTPNKNIYIPEQNPDLPRPDGWSWDLTWVPADQIKCDLYGKTTICSCINFPPRTIIGLYHPYLLITLQPQEEACHLQFITAIILSRVYAAGPRWFVVVRTRSSGGMVNVWFPRRTPFYAVHRLFTAFILVHGGNSSTLCGRHDRRRWMVLHLLHGRPPSHATLFSAHQ